MKSIICYSLGDIEPKLRVRFNRELYGYEDKSNHGRYNYKRKGILSNVRYNKPLDSVIILDSKIRSVIRILKKYKATYISYKLR
jgi:hypothetical protein